MHTTHRVTAHGNFAGVFIQAQVNMYIQLAGFHINPGAAIDLAMSCKYVLHQEQ